MTRVIHYICNIKIKDFLLCQYVIYGPVRIILTSDFVFGTGIYLSIMDFLRGQYVIYGPFRIILTEDEVWYMDLLGLYWPKTKSEVNIILTGPPSKRTTFIHITRDRRGRDRMVVWFTTTYAISAYHHWCCEFESRSGMGILKIVVSWDGLYE
jgi:hypothetical protein